MGIMHPSATVYTEHRHTLLQLIVTALRNVPPRVLYIMTTETVERNPLSLPVRLSQPSMMPGMCGSLPLSLASVVAHT